MWKRVITAILFDYSKKVPGSGRVKIQRDTNSQQTGWPETFRRQYNKWICVFPLEPFRWDSICIFGIKAKTINNFPAIIKENLNKFVTWNNAKQFKK